MIHTVKCRGCGAELGLMVDYMPTKAQADKLALITLCCGCQYRAARQLERMEWLARQRRVRR